MIDGFKKLWIEALRSGDYKQHRHAICNKNNDQFYDATAFCCIGVAAKICAVKPIPHISFTTEWVSEQLGLTGSQRRWLVNMNDERECSFDEIADYIEGNL